MGVSRCNEVNDGNCKACAITWFNWPLPLFFQTAYNDDQRANIPCTLTAKQRQSSLYHGQSMPVGSKRWSPNGRFFLAMQGDGNLVVYRISDNRAIWASNTMGSGAVKALMQYDGNFVLYTSYGVPKWSSNTIGRPDNFLLLQDDGNMIIDAMGAPTVQWAANSGGYMTKAANLRIESVNSTSVVDIVDIGTMTMQKALQNAMVGIFHFDKDPSSAPGHSQASNRTLDGIN
jgi:hypothetical protein